MNSARRSGRRQTLGTWTALAATLIVVGCGGGGGGGAAGGGANGATGFVPAPPSLGNVLYADAAVLRPLRDGAAWVYRGVQQADGSTIAYATERRLTASGQDFVETEFSQLDGTSVQRVVNAAGGSIRLQESLDGLSGSTSVSYIELRSPVRANDQITLLDQLGVALTEDLDGDQKNDSADIGAYSRVVGDEDVALPDLGRSMRALRVDTTLTIRIRLTSRNAAEPALTVLASTWYASGVGVIRETTTMPSASGVGTDNTDQRLQYWDGVATGLGMMPSVRTAASGGSPSAGPWLGYPYSAVSVGERVFVLTSIGGTPVRPDLGVVLSVLDQRGRVMASREHADLALNVNARPQLMPLGEGAAFALTEQGVYADPYQLENLRLVKFDSTGQRALGPVLVQGALPRSLSAASDGQTVWVTWVERVLPFGPYRVMVQRFDVNGVALSVPELLDSFTDRIPEQTNIAASAGRALVNWRVPHFSGDAYRHALVPASGAASSGTLASGTHAFGGESGRPTPFISSSAAMLTWYRPLDTQDPPPQPSPLHGVVVDSTASIRRSSTGPIDEELLQLPIHADFMAGMVIEGGDLLWSGSGASVLSATEVSADAYIDLVTLPPATGPLSAAAPATRRFRDSTPGVIDRGTTVRHIIPFQDRWLLIGYSTALTVSVVYRR